VGIVDLMADGPFLGLYCAVGELITLADEAAMAEVCVVGMAGMAVPHDVEEEKGER
jgi:uncharacterized protein (UPF0210 family)